MKKCFLLHFWAQCNKFVKNKKELYGYIVISVKNKILFQRLVNNNFIPYSKYMENMTHFTENVHANFAFLIILLNWLLISGIKFITLLIYFCE